MSNSYSRIFSLTGWTRRTRRERIGMFTQSQHQNHITTFSFLFIIPRLHLTLSPCRHVPDLIQQKNKLDVWICFHLSLCSWVTSVCVCVLIYRQAHRERRGIKDPRAAEDSKGKRASRASWDRAACRATWGYQACRGHRGRRWGVISPNYSVAAFCTNLSLKTP